MYEPSRGFLSRTHTMEIVLLGNAGQLGRALAGTLACIGNVTGFDRPELDVGNFDALRAALRNARPDVVVNAAAYTDVDGAEADEAAAMRINADAVAVLGEECR